VLLVVALLAVLAVPVGIKLARLRHLGKPLHVQTTDAPAPVALQAPGPTGPPQRLWRAGGRNVVDSALLDGRGQVLFSEEVAHRSWRVNALDARTGEVRWRNGRENTGHVEAWAVTDDTVVLGYHHSASRLAWRLSRAASLVGVDPVSGKPRWTRTDLVLYGEGPGDYAPFLAYGTTVYGQTQYGTVVAVDTTTGKARWRHHPPPGCGGRGIVAGPAGVAMSMRCGGSVVVELLDPADGAQIWRREFGGGQAVRLLAVGTGVAAVAVGSADPHLEVLGPGGSTVTTAPCECPSIEPGAGADAGLAGSVLVLAGGRAPLTAVDAATGEVRWRVPAPTGVAASRLLGQNGGVRVVTERGSLVRVDPATGKADDVADLQPATLTGAFGPFVLVQLPGAVELYGTAAP
jgi:outer membrane protein assembly factor BamB